MVDPSQRTAGAFAEGMQRWIDAMQALVKVPPGSPEFQQTLASLQSELAAQLECWLRTSHPFAGSQFTPPMPPPAFTGTGASGYGHSPDGGRIGTLLTQWVHLQGQFAVHWSTVGRVAAEKFGLQLSRLRSGESNTDLRKLYDLWIDCAEEAYAETAHSEGFSRSVAQVTNTAVALQLAGRQYLQEWARAAGLPTREEFAALTQRIAQLEQARRRPSRSSTPGRPRTNAKRRR